MIPPSAVYHLGPCATCATCATIPVRATWTPWSVVHSNRISSPTRTSEGKIGRGVVTSRLLSSSGNMSEAPFLVQLVGLVDDPVPVGRLDLVRIGLEVVVRVEVWVAGIPHGTLRVTHDSTSIPSDRISMPSGSNSFQW